MFTENLTEKSVEAYDGSGFTYTVPESEKAKKVGITRRIPFMEERSVDIARDGTADENGFSRL